MWQFLFFQIADQHFALPVACVERVLPAMEITPVEGAPSSLLGIIDVHGKIIPVIDIRKRLALPVKAIDLSDQLIIVKTSTIQIAFVSDQVEDVVSLSEEQVIPLQNFVQKTHPYVENLIQLDEHLIKLYDFPRVFDLEEMNIDPVVLGIKQ